jgi:hypothetical protein
MGTRIAGLIVFALLLGGCDRVGSEAWCEKLGEKPKGEWTLDETGNYAKYCVLGMDDERWCKKLEGKPKGEWTANEAARYAKDCLVGREG